MRKHLFSGDVPYEEFEAELFQSRLKDNTLLGWLRSMVMPSNKD